MLIVEVGLELEEKIEYYVFNTRIKGKEKEIVDFTMIPEVGMEHLAEKNSYFQNCFDYLTKTVSKAVISNYQPSLTYDLRLKHKDI